MKLHLWVEGRRFLKVPLLITDLGQYDLILGRKWLSEQDIWLDVRERRLVWPEDRAQPTAQEGIQRKALSFVPKSILRRPSATATQQADAERRDRQLDNQVQMEQAAIGQGRGRQIYWPPRTEAMDRYANLQKMGRALRAEPAEPYPEKPTSYHHSPSPQEVREANVALIGAAGFDRHATKNGSQVFITSLLEIDKTIEERRAILDPQEEREI